jgi:hypothetical protein
MKYTKKTISVSIIFGLLLIPITGVWAAGWGRHAYNYTDIPFTLNWEPDMSAGEGCVGIITPQCYTNTPDSGKLDASAEPATTSSPGAATVIEVNYNSSSTCWIEGAITISEINDQGWGTYASSNCDAAGLHGTWFDLPVTNPQGQQETVRFVNNKPTDGDITICYGDRPPCN